MLLISTEAQYANSLKKIVIPLRYQNFQPSGWLGLIVKPLLHYNVETRVYLRSNLPKILEAVEIGVMKYSNKGIITETIIVFSLFVTVSLFCTSVGTFADNLI